jgi:hypothetical protein
MVTQKVAQDIIDIFDLKENQGLSNDEKRKMISEIIIDVYTKGYDSGRKNGIKDCITSLTDLNAKNIKS